ncbi:macrolide family glycosyltransferase [Catenuloplanes japonicus]|uniref:macrolide family glycosyltransferase n=1 Tax=Catenuloplanes japonicus TaxID=33876 RepID=UPI00052779AF|nr:macrolide family glycosyltransferase [Catenuloplanes japonicus]
MQRHLAFVGRDGAGHINPTLPVVAELVRRGHRVTYAVGAPFAEAVRQAGAGYLPLPENDLGGGQAGQSAMRNADVVAMIAGMLLDRTGRELPVLRDGFAADRPDAVCYDGSSVSGAMLAELLGVPAVQLVPTFAANAHYSLLDEFVPDPERLAASEAAADARVRAYGATLGITRTLGTALTRTAADLNIVFVPRRFQYHGETFGDDYVFVGPSGHDRVVAAGWEPPVAGTPLLFVALGTMMNQHPEFFRLCIDAFAGTGWQVAMAVGTRVDPAELGEIPPNVEVRPYFPQLEVLAHARVFVTHAGMNSAMEAILHRVPTVSVPQTPEQVANARRLDELGLGVTLPEQTAAALRDAVTAMDTSDVVRGNLADLARHVQEAGGAVAAADAVEKLWTPTGG